MGVDGRRSHPSSRRSASLPRALRARVRRRRALHPGGRHRPLAAGTAREPPLLRGDRHAVAYVRVDTDEGRSAHAALLVLRWPSSAVTSRSSSTCWQGMGHGCTSDCRTGWASRVRVAAATGRRSVGRRPDAAAGRAARLEESRVAGADTRRIGVACRSSRQRAAPADAPHQGSPTPGKGARRSGAPLGHLRGSPMRDVDSPRRVEPTHRGGAEAMSDPQAIRTTHVGSLIRPDDIVAIMRRLDKGEQVDPAERQAALEKGVREVVRRQKEAGIDIVSMASTGSRRGTSTSPSAWMASPCGRRSRRPSRTCR